MPRNGPSGWYSQAWMSRADQSLTSTTPKTWSAKPVHRRPRSPSAARHADHEADLGLDVEPCRRARTPGPSAVGPLPAGPDDRRAGDDHRAGPAVVADRQVLPVGQQRRLVGPEDPPDVGGVVLGGVEVDVVADLERQTQLDLGERAAAAARRRPGAPGRSAARRSAAAPRVHCGRPRAMKSLSVGGAARRRPGPARPPPPPCEVEHAGRRPVRRSARPPSCRNTPYGRLSRRTASRRAPVDPGHPSYPPFTRPSRIRSVSGSSMLHEPKPDPQRPRAVPAGPGRLDQRHRVGGGEHLGHLGDLGAVGRGGGAGQHVEEAVVGEAGLRVGVPDRVVQARR